MKLLIDSREQRPLTFKDGVFSSIGFEGLPFGDYWAEIDGKQIPLAFERKSKEDLFGTLGSGMTRFKNEISRAKENNFTLILVIECSMKEVFDGTRYSTIKGESILKRLASLRVRYDLEYHFFNDRRESARFIEDIFEAVGRNWKRPDAMGVAPLPCRQEDTGSQGSVEELPG